MNDVPERGFGPVAGGERISTLDTLRGFALLGILLMNIVGFGLPFAAYFNPTIAGGIAGWNLAAWAAQAILFDGKMRAMCSMLFGAGVLLLIARGEKRGAGIATADIYYRRTLWLLLFGVAHAYLLWWGDILYPYALCALALFPFRVVRPKRLLIAVGVLIALMTAGSVGQGFMLRDMRDKAGQAVADAEAGKTLTDEQKKAKEDWEKYTKLMAPSREDVDKEIAAFRGGYVSNLKQRATLVAGWHGKPYYSPLFADMYTMMLLGMALFKLDVLTGARPRAFYVRLAAIGFLVGLPINSVSAYFAVRTDFDITAYPIVFSAYHIGRLAMMLGYMSLIVLAVQSGLFRRLMGALAAVGQMAFSNYILQSVLCGFLFYGIGFGLHSRLERYQLFAAVAAVWAFNLVWSPVWLRYFHFGPLEWCWRSLTYWKRQPWRKAPAPEPVPQATGASAG
jgi:uncharacterized protein